MGNACFKEDQKAKYSATQPPDDPGLTFYDFITNIEHHMAIT